MGCGLPVVLSRTGGTGALVEDGVNGFSHTWGDVEALTAALRRFVQDRSLVVRMGASSRQRALAYGWEALAKRYLELFELS
jgi:glycosyltransferase involved in cell wall biosynthesis